MPDHYLDSVAAFHRATGVERLSRLSSRERLVMVALRATLIDEEAREYRDALEDLTLDFTTQTLRHAAKEAADLLYVVAGTVDVLGATLIGLDVPPRLPHPDSTFLRDHVLHAQCRILVDELTDLGRMVNHGDDISDAVDAVLADIQTVTGSLHASARAHRIPLREAFDAVHHSNMSKLDPETGKALHRSDGKILKGPGYREADLSFLRVA